MQTNLNLEFDEETLEAAKRILNELELSDGWMRMDRLAFLADLKPRTIRKVIVTYLRPRGYRVLSSSKGYKIARTDEEIAEASRWMQDRAITGIENFARQAGISLTEAIERIRRSMLFQNML